MNTGDNLSQKNSGVSSGKLIGTGKRQTDRTFSVGIPFYAQISLNVLIVMPFLYTKSHRYDLSTSLEKTDP